MKSAVLPRFPYSLVSSTFVEAANEPAALVKLAASGLATLVPPHTDQPSTCPSYGVESYTQTPESGLASSAISGVPRLVPTTEATRLWNDGMATSALNPPPPLFQVLWLV